MSRQAIWESPQKSQIKLAISGNQITLRIWPEQEKYKRKKYRKTLTEQMACKLILGIKKKKKMIFCD